MIRERSNVLIADLTIRPLQTRSPEGKFYRSDFPARVLEKGSASVNVAATVLSSSPKQASYATCRVLDFNRASLGHIERGPGRADGV